MRNGSQKQFTVTLSSELGYYLEERAAETGLNKSAVVSQAQLDRQHRKELLMREDYEEMAEQHVGLVREFEHVNESTGLPDYQANLSRMLDREPKVYVYAGIGPVTRFPLFVWPLLACGSGTRRRISR